MIKKIDIPSFGQFKDYQWGQNGLNEIDLKKLNIIYGRNYSGKTTLSRIFACLEQQEMIKGYEKGSFTLTLEGGGTISQDNLVSSYEFRVYNSDFVRNNLGFFYDESKPIEPFTLIGTENNEIQKQIDDLEKKLGDKEDLSSLRGREQQTSCELKDLEKQLKEKNGYIEEKIKAEANKTIKGNPLFWKQGDGQYDKRNLLEEIDIVGNDRLPNEERESLEKTVKEERKAEISPLPEATLPKLQEYIKEAKETIEKEIGGFQIIQALKEDMGLSEWVEKGYNIHQNDHCICKFCNNPISELRWDELKKHFSKESQDLKRKIEERIKKLEEAKESLADFTASISVHAFYHSFSERYLSWKRSWEEVESGYRNCLDNIVTQLKERLNDIFTTHQWKEIENPSDRILESIKSINELISENNKLTEQLSESQNEARRKLRYNEILRFKEEIDYDKLKEEEAQLNESTSKKEEELNHLRKDIQEYEKQKQELESKLQDEGKAAEAINNYLADFFGSSHLRLESKQTEDTNHQELRTRFIVTRGGTIAYNLSDGERSLIAFCYFMAKIKDELNSNSTQNLIIFIDDPISSLDSNHIFYMFSLIETIICQPKKYHQLFISTHNLEFLKYSQRLTVVDVNNNSFLSIYREEKPGGESRSIIQKMPPLLKEHITEYGFLFKEIYTYTKEVKGDRSKSIENGYSQFYNLPNNIRKFLECYFSYRHPHSQNPLDRENLKWLLGDTPFPAMINRIINEGSHLAWGVRGASLITDTKEAEDASLLILKAIKKKDPDHFDSLCRACGINPQKDGVNLG